MQITDRIRRLSTADQELKSGPSDGRIWIDTDGNIKVNIDGVTSDLSAGGGGGSGDVTAASNFGTDNRIIRSNGVSKGVQASAATLDDSGNLTGINGITVGNTGLLVKDTDASHTLAIVPGSNLTANRSLSIITGDADRVLTLTGDATASGTNTGDQNVFTTIAVSGQSNVVSDQASDTLTLVAGSGITITTDAAADSVTITASSAATPPFTLLTADPGSPANDTWWAVRTGTSPTMTVAVKARIAGVTVTIASITN